MEEKRKKELQYLTPTVSIRELEPIVVLASSATATSGGWKVDDGSSGDATGASSGGWSVDDGGSNDTGASTGGWSTN
jgi:hypothetical protein